MNPIKVLGIIDSIKARTIDVRDGDQAKAIDPGSVEGAMLVQVGNQAGRARAALDHLAGQGSAEGALKAHFPHLPAKALALLLAAANAVTEALEDDGRIDVGEASQIGAHLLHEGLQD